MKTVHEIKPGHHILRLPFPEEPGGYIIISFRNRKVLEEVYKDDAFVTFFYDHEGKAGAEWEPKYGPIHLCWPAPELNSKSMPHFFYPFAWNTPLSWSQLAVEREGLKDALRDGDFAHIFHVLKEWAENAAEDGHCEPVEVTEKQRGGR